ncbi:flagellar transcriptional regulator FlhD [Verticiella sediminum]|uniref:Flagellar transcriptional regulator FlhD n=1 Tax=Verticiella sediminum TaxID=1247510 RepID=A0A556ARX9_9BURK|nr:flagellar transcriptional regulator FlhD [Verticiella sediminum]TSH95704.1 flagellar transcriptional regulator FlhD [Verticiella sediminum]
MSSSSGNLLAEIREVNLSYLLLAQRMLNEDFATATFRLGFSSEVGEIMRRLTLSQTVRLASSSSLLCQFRFDEGSLLTAVSEDALGGVLQQAHTTLLLASQPVEQIG